MMTDTKRQNNADESFIKIEQTQHKGVSILRLNRPKALNALCNKLCDDLIDALKKLESDVNTKVIIITGNEKSFAAGADIKEMQKLNFSEAYNANMLSKWDFIKNIRKPLIAGVSGYALGGGCELAMMCDIIIAAENAKFGQPEVLIGTIPGMGGSQRLCRAVGKSKAMEIILTGNQFTAQQALQYGLVSNVVPTNNLEEECIKLASNIAEKSLPILMAAKECVNKSYETTLNEGLEYERRMFHSTFATEDKKEGMTAFVEKRPAVWKNM